VHKREAKATFAQTSDDMENAFSQSKHRVFPDRERISFNSDADKRFDFGGFADNIMQRSGVVCQQAYSHISI
jgi:hypothetical protein